MSFHSGYVSVIGRPNVGKSTLLNGLIGEKISIISNKAQTTRNTISLIYTDDRMQIVFLDTPGVQIPRNELGQAMLKISRDALEGIDLCLFVTDTSEKVGKLDQKILDELEKFKDTPIFLMLNKIDLLENQFESKEEAQSYLDGLIQKYEAMDLFEKILPISAKDPESIDRVLEEIYHSLPEGPLYYPEEMITDRSERFIITEIIREKCLIYLQEEIPHGIYVGMDKMKLREDGSMYDIYATIYVEKESHKGMVIGKGGQMIEKIGRQARLDIQKFVNKKVNLKLWVKVEKNWRKNKKKVQNFGYEQGHGKKR